MQRFCGICGDRAASDRPSLPAVSCWAPGLIFSRPRLAARAGVAAAMDLVVAAQDQLSVILDFDAAVGDPVHVTLLATPLFFPVDPERRAVEIDFFLPTQCR